MMLTVRLLLLRTASHLHLQETQKWFRNPKAAEDLFNDAFIFFNWLNQLFLLLLLLYITNIFQNHYQLLTKQLWKYIIGPHFLSALAVATSINVHLQLALTDYTNTQYKPEDVLLATISNWKCTSVVQKKVLNALSHSAESEMFFSVEYWLPWIELYNVWSKQVVLIAFYCILRSTWSMWRDDKQI